MRVISGIYKRRRFDVPRTFKARPTTDFAKENLFNVLNNYIDFEEGITALDLFAGTGSDGVEHLHIGALAGGGHQDGQRDGDSAFLSSFPGGRFFRARDTAQLSGIYAEIDKLEPVQRQGQRVRPRIERYPVPLGAALGVGLLALLLRRRTA